MFAATASPAFAGGTLQVDISGAGEVTGSGGIACERAPGGQAPKGTCSGAYQGTLQCTTGPRPTCKEIPAIVELTAHGTANGFIFDGWSGACSNQEVTCTLSMTRSFDVTAVFKDIQDPGITFGGVTPTVRGAVTLQSTATDNGGVARVDFTLGGVTISDPVAPYSATFNTAALKDGTVTAVATAVDTAGRTKTSPAVNTVIDNAAPSVTVGGPNGAVFRSGGTQSWTIQSSDATTGVASVACSVVPAGAPAAFSSCSAAGAHSVSGKPHGAYVFTARVTDKAGNVTDVARAFAIDEVAPKTAVSAGVADGATTSDTALTWAFGADEPNAAFACRVYPAALTPGAFAPCSAAGAHTAAGFSPGVYTFEVQATDAAGNVETAPVKRTFTVVPAPAPAAPPAGPAGPSGPTGSTIPGLNATGKSAPQINVTLTFTFSNSTKKQTKLTSLVLKGVPDGATVSTKGFKKTNASGTVSLKKLLKKPFKAGSTIVVTVSKPGMGTAIKTLKILPRKTPVVTTQCQAPGAAKPVPC
ncbi:Ig-like domain repeat protein [Solirubrobacter sp. CPCC 204708]|uniref:Ig-like domain-containing protein n=1 Tax=Solirubrobacter deserti TaxID=2282478 RepID=A0ABT4RIH8_9ACTN|nr:Ig-like domain-containing protein [Solirubrobacter deserti]MBE2320324.1 Ig-like domain repeat protein [Solirubrobacter deserti]MDA0138290.1 Ig-like domain-containing protein [Solirubrobacter deserti]